MQRVRGTLNRRPSGTSLWPMFLVIALLLSAVACRALDASAPDPSKYSKNVDSYVALAPPVLHAGQTHHVPVSLFDGTEPAQGTVLVSLANPSGQNLAQAEAFVPGNGTIELELPEMAEGAYVLNVKGQGANGGGFAETADVQVQAEPVVLFLETDKPIYKPGQQVHMRALRLDRDLRPLPGPVTVEIQDAKGIKVYKRTLEAGQFGMAEGTLPLSTEPNLGVWKLTAISGAQSTQLDVQVDEYVLPKYEVTVELPKDWVLPDESVTGTVSAEYSFGKPVRGEVEIIASRYVGVWEEYARYDTNINGEASFRLPPPGYVAGTPTAGGQGNVQLHVAVREPATGYAEETTHLLTVAAAAVNLQLVPESSYFKPGLPLALLAVAETPEHEPVDTDVTLEIQYHDEDFEVTDQETIEAEIKGGTALIETNPPENAVAMSVVATSPENEARLVLEASYSPSSNFIHLEQAGEPLLAVGEQATFRVHSTDEARNFYYEVIARGRLVFSDVSHTPNIAFRLTDEMAPSARLVVYQILQNNEVAADHIPFHVAASYPMQVEVGFSADQTLPGEEVDIHVSTEGPARVGLAAVDRSVFILAEKRLNLQQVFAELERLYAAPQAQVYLSQLPARVSTRGAAETFQDAGVLVLSDKSVPDGPEFSRPVRGGFSSGNGWWVLLIFGILALVFVAIILGALVLAVYGIVRGVYRAASGMFLLTLLMIGILAGCGGVSQDSIPTPAPAAQESEAAQDSYLAEVERVRQFFPETWLWADVMTDAAGQATLSVTAPDSITTWNLRAVGVSPEHGFGVANAELTVFQPFFLQVDLPYSAIRGEEFPVDVALYNYLDEPQDFLVELDESSGFTLLGPAVREVTVAPNEVAGLDFDVQLTEIGNVPIKVTARSRETADAVIETLLVEPEGVAQEAVDNAILSAGDRLDFEITTPPGAVPGSDRTYVTLTGSFVAQTLEGLENLLQMPYGCGEQNMILFAPNIYVARYLEASGELKPEIMAKAEHLMTTGYQRELTYQRRDGSFSAFGDSDDSGSLWLTSFVLKSFAQADGIIYIDESVLQRTKDWVRRLQRGDGSFQRVGFVHHTALLGGLQGETALTAYVAIALLEAGEYDASNRALAYLARQLENITDDYTMAIVAYALALGDSPQAAADSRERLLKMAISDGEELYWAVAPVEATGYATLALLEMGDGFNASRAARWLAGQRNPYGGFDSTQDTVVGLQALIGFASQSRFDVDMIVGLSAGNWRHEVVVNEANADVLQVVEAPAGVDIQLFTSGSGQVVTQVVHRYNIHDVERPAVEMFDIHVDYSADHVAVDDIIDINAEFTFTPPGGARVDAGMIVLDISTPTGFAPVAATLQALVDGVPQLKRYDVAGR